MPQVSIDTPGRPKAGVERMKKANLKIDMTPMVDLGFLLISFFIFTTEISKPAITNLFMPKDGDSTKVPQSKSLTILLDNNDQIFYYNGDMNEVIKNNQIFQTSYNEINGIGNVIRQKQNQLAKRKTDKKELVILIKPFTNTSYRNVVDILDEMLINEVTRYMIADPENEEKMFLERQNRNR
jgi:biopolymer transport protein ExbD